MLRASATRALRQCGKRRSHNFLDSSAASSSSSSSRIVVVSRGSFQRPSSSISAPSELLACRTTRCLASSSSNNAPSVDASRDSSSSSLRRGNGLSLLDDDDVVSSPESLLLPLLRLNDQSTSALVARRPSSSSSSLLSPFALDLGRNDIIINGPMSQHAALLPPQQQQQHQRRSFSTNVTARKTSPTAAPVVGPNDDDEQREGKKSSTTINGGAATAESQNKPAAKSKSPSDHVESTTIATTTTTTITSSSPHVEKSIVQKSNEALSRGIKSLASFLIKLPSLLWFYLTHPSELRIKLTELKKHAVDEAQHFWTGCKLLAADVRTARRILGRVLRGSTLSRRERKQLLRTSTDVFRLVPMSIFVLVPFMEFALPFALKLFPGMLPSTFRDDLKEEEKMKRELQMRISMAGFFQDTLANLAKEQKKVAETRKHDAGNEGDAESIEIARREASTAGAFLEFLKKARTGEAIPPDVIIRFAKNVEDTLMLDNLGRMQLINLCKYMGISPYGSNDLLRFYLRHKIRVLKDDDQRITWEGIDFLTKMELREACRERGMRSTGLSKDAYRSALQQWLDLSVHKNVPISLLIMSRTFYLHDEMQAAGGESEAMGIVDADGSKGVSGLADVMSGIDKEVLNEIVLEMASSEEKSTNADIRKIQMEVLEHQNELIEEEQQERDAAAKEKEEKQKEKATKADHEQQQQADAAETSISGDVAYMTKEEAMEDKTTFGKDVGDVPMKEKVFESTTEFDKLESPIFQDAVEKAAGKEAAPASEGEQTELSTEEIDAINQLVSADPVQKEREELQRIKDAMVDVEEPLGASPDEQQLDGAVDEDEIPREQTVEASLEMSSAISPSEPIRTEEAQEEALKSIKELEDAIEKEAAEANVMSMDNDAEGEKSEKAAAAAQDALSEEGMVGDPKLQKAIDRLKTRVESMVGNIETQLTDVEVKIGDKFHLLDKDGDGVLTMDEMARVLQTVLRRELTPEEATAIAADIDTDEDGVFSIAELAQWSETNTIVKLAEDGREKDLDDMITERVQERRKLKEEDEEWTGM